MDVIDRLILEAVRVDHEAVPDGQLGGPKRVKKVADDDEDDGDRDDVSGDGDEKMMNFSFTPSVVVIAIVIIIAICGVIVIVIVIVIVNGISFANELTSREKRK